MWEFQRALNDIGRQTVLCIGDVMLDNFVYGEVARISPEAPARVIVVKCEEIAVGSAGIGRDIVDASGGISSAR